MARLTRNQHRPLSAALLITAMAMAVVGAAGVGASTTAVFSNPTEIQLPVNASATSNAHPTSVSCWSAGDCIAVGYYETTAAVFVGMYAVETNGAFATAVEIMAPANAITNGLYSAHLSAVSCPSAQDCEAVGRYEDTSDHFQAMGVAITNDVAATAVEVNPPAGASAIPNTDPVAISCWSVGNCLAVGTYDNGASAQQAMDAVETNGSFTSSNEIAPPANADSAPEDELLGVSCPGSGQCVAGGDYRDSTPLTQAMVSVQSGASFTSTEVTLPPDAEVPAAHGSLSAVSCANAGNCTAVGDYQSTDNGDNYVGFSVTEAGGSFGQSSEFSPPADGVGQYLDPDAVSCQSPGNCEAAGTYDDQAVDEQAFVVTESGGTFAGATKVLPPTGAAADPDADAYGISCVAVGVCTAVAGYTDSTGRSEAMGTDSIASLSLTTQSLPSGTVGQSYSASLGASGGGGSYSYSVTSGSLPAGLTLDAATGAITGTPSASGTVTPTFTVTDPGPPSQQAASSLSLSIAAVASPTTTTTPPLSSAPPLTPHTVAPSPVISITSTKIVLSTKKPPLAPIELSCRTATCSGSVALDEKTLVKTNKKVKEGHKTVTKVVTTTVLTTLGSANYRIPKNKSATVTLALTKTGSAVLANVTHKALTETLIVKITGGVTRTKAVVVS